jgi:3-oxoacyl-[acyl-carrier protein] reductase
MELGLKGQIALVTAGSEGLGFECALKLAKEGCDIAICARREEGLKRAEKEIRSVTLSEVLAIKTDLVQADEIQSLVEMVHHRYGRIDILVANSGHIPYGGLFDLGDLEWLHAFDLLLMSMVRLSRQVIPHMKSQKKGDIVFLSSSVAKEPSPHLLLSNVFRVGVIALGKSLARGFAADNIRVNAVAMGYFDTGRVRKRIDDIVNKGTLSREDAGLEIAGDIPWGRIGTSAELAELVAFIVSRRSEFLTGSTIQIDGGKCHGIF